MKALILILAMISFNSFAAQVGEFKKSDCGAINQSSEKRVPSSESGSSKEAPKAKTAGK